MLLSPTDLTAALATLPGWTREGDAIVKIFDCRDFPSAIAFVTRLGYAAERADHHPDLDVRWKRVRVLLTTHDAGGLTAKDIALAAAADRAAGGLT
jgi:4a-hydroxytetrahydrobiopterin dehydratase